jgi:ATP-binding cassette, subfamily B, bacterial
MTRETREPTTFLAKTLWRFSEHRRLIVWFVVLSIAANLTSLFQPIIFSFVVDAIAKNGINPASLPHIVFLLSLFPLQVALFWSPHGPSRVIERMVAYWAAIKYRRYLIDGVLDLGMSWHAEHDSGDTIDRVNKASEGLGDFGQNVFQVIHIAVKVFGTTAILVWFSPWLGISVFGLVVLSFGALFQFDKRLLPQYRRLNEFANKASAALFDAISNVATVKILRIEKPIVDGVLKQFRASRQVFLENAKVNEWKWCAGNLCFEGIKVLPLMVFLYLAVG